jgi:hypothetical protein
MNEGDWYEVTEGAALLQGDILRRCPVFLISDGWTWPLTSAKQVEVDVSELDLVVMTQSCDLENDKVEDVLLARVISWSDAVRTEVQRGNTIFLSGKFRRPLVDGFLPGLSLLHKRVEEPRLAWSVTDFHRLYTLPKPFLNQFAAASGPRLRLRSPYREHLAQAFARFFMRVGLPHAAKAFEKEGDVKV